MNKIIFMVCMLVCNPFIQAQKPKLHQIQVNADGFISPRYLLINHLDTVQWLLSDKTQSIIPITISDTSKLNCTSFKSVSTVANNDFTGPPTSVLPGIVALSPDGPGFEIVNKNQGIPPCPANTSKASAGNQYLCENGLGYATMDWTWQNPSISGVFIRLRWDEVHQGPGKFNWTVLDREITKAVSNGKMYSLGFKAGLTATPAWIFNPAVAGNLTVKKLHFRDNEDEETCGTPGDMGSPADDNYRKLYFDLWRAVAAHIKEKNAWYRALGFVKPSGMNLFTHENRLPNNCKENCDICNPEVWAVQGKYTPNALYDFYKQQFDLLDTLFPDKYMQYALIQAGFPLVNNKGEYKAPFTEPLPGGTAQTEKIMEIGRMQHGLKFIVSHNGLSTRPQDKAIPMEPCPNEGKHPAVRPFAGASSGCPNAWALREGEAGQMTGWQSQNARTINDPVSIESSLLNAWDNSDGIYVELYEERIWEAETAGPVLDPKATGFTLKQWDDRFYQRVKSFWGAKVADPFPLTHQHVFKRTTTNKNEFQTFYYTNPKSCINNTKTFGAIVIRSESSVPYQDYISSSELLQFKCHPNPFEHSISFTFQLRSASTVKLTLLNLLGQDLVSILDNKENKGSHHFNWTGVDQLPAGVYLAQLNVDGVMVQQRLVKQ